MTEARRKELFLRTKSMWTSIKSLPKFSIPQLGISSNRAASFTWSDKKWIQHLAKVKEAEFYFKAASARASFGREFYNTLNQGYFGTSRYLKIYYAYMLSKFEDAILRGIA